MNIIWIYMFGEKHITIVYRAQFELARARYGWLG